METNIFLETAWRNTILVAYTTILCLVCAVLVRQFVEMAICGDDGLLLYFERLVFKRAWFNQLSPASNPGIVCFNQEIRLCVARVIRERNLNNVGFE
jgi:hypothetical protein